MHAQSTTVITTRPKRSTPGIVTRHSRHCPTRIGGACTAERKDGCVPSYESWVYSKREGKKIRAPHVFSTLKEAKDWRTDAAAALRKGTLSAPTRETVEQAARAWLAGAKAGEILKPDGTVYKPSVIRQYESDLERFVIPELGTVKLSSLHRRDVQRHLVDHLVGSGLSGSRVRGALMPLRAICRRAIRNDEITVNPTANLTLPAVADARDRAASPKEAAALLDALPAEDRPLWATAFYAGLRRGELRALRWSDVDDAITEIRVQHGWDDVEGEIAPKSKKSVRRVPIAGALRLLLLEHKARTGRRGDELVFGRTASTPFTPTHVRERALGAWAATAVGAFLRGEPPLVELEPIGLHECRHTFVSLMHAAGRSLEEIGDYVGHTSAYVTDRYRHLLEGARTEAVAALDALLAGAAR